MEAQPSVVDKAPFVNATGEPDVKVIPAVLPKYQLLNRADCEKASVAARLQTSINKINRRPAFRLPRKTLSALYLSCNITFVYASARSLVERIYDSFA